MQSENEGNGIGRGLNPWLRFLWTLLYPLSYRDPTYLEIFMHIYPIIQLIKYTCDYPVFLVILSSVVNHLMIQMLRWSASFQSMLGDLNLPSINWNTNMITSSDSIQSAEFLLSFMADNLCSQFVLVPTRADNILDLYAFFQLSR